MCVILSIPGMEVVSFVENAWISCERNGNYTGKGSPISPFQYNLQLRQLLKLSDHNRGTYSFN
jgi:hypothetical protein